MQLLLPPSFLHPCRSMGCEERPQLKVNAEVAACNMFFSSHACSRPFFTDGRSGKFIGALRRARKNIESNPVLAGQRELQLFKGQLDTISGEGARGHIMILRFRSSHEENSIRYLIFSARWGKRWLALFPPCAFSFSHFSLYCRMQFR